ncbi:MAG: L,D-transpeptidase [Candidatus Moranbacteria bacterium]|nr:L,D-transpeptidase [Candidatus Moranbacteria bacterium]
MNIAFVLLFILVGFLPAFGENSPSIPKEGKVIFINQLTQTGTAYENGIKLFDFNVITGDGVKITDPGEYVVVQKRRRYFSKTHNTWMPYSLFFIWNGDRKAIHEGEVPPKEHLNPKKRRSALATNGCVHVTRPEIVRLFDWAEEGKTKIIIHGTRSGD